MCERGLGEAPFSLGTVVLGAVFLTSLYNGTEGNLLPVVLWRGLFSMLIASEAAQDVIAAVLTTGIMILAVFALLVAGPRERRGLSQKAGPRQPHTRRAPFYTRRGGP